MGKSVKLISLECPHCNATIEVQDGLDSFYCNYCGNKILLDGLSDAAYNAKVKIKNMEHKEKLQAMKNEEEKRSSKALLIGCIIFISVCVVLGIVAWIASDISEKKAEEREAAQLQQLQQIEMQLSQAIIDEDYDTALIYANQLRYPSYALFEPQVHVWDQKREMYIRIIEEKTGKKYLPDETTQTGQADESGN